MKEDSCVSYFEIESSRLCFQEKYARALRMEKKSNLTISQLTTKLQELENKCGRYEDENEELMCRLEKLNSERGKNNEIESLLLKLEVSERKLSELEQTSKSTIENILAEKNNVQMLYDNCKASLAATQENLESTREELIYCQADIEANVQEIACKEKRIIDLEQLFNESQSNHQKLKRFYQEKQDTAVATYTQTEPDIEAIQNQALVASLTGELDILRGEVSELEERLNDANYLAEDAKEQLTILQSDSSGQDNELSSLQHKHQLLQEQYATTCMKLQSSDKEIDRLTKNWRELVESNAQYKKDLGEIRKGSETLHTLNLDLKRQCDAYIETIAECQDKSTHKETKLKKEIASLKTALEELKGQFQEMCGRVLPADSANGAGDKEQDSGKRQLSLGSTDGDDYCSDEFEDEGDVLTSPIRSSGVAGVRQLARQHIEACGRREGDSFTTDCDSSEVGKRKKRVRGVGTKSTQADDTYHSPLYRGSESAPLLPSLHSGDSDSPNQQLSDVAKGGRGMIKSARAGPSLPSHHPYYQEDDSIKKKMKKKKADLPSTGSKKSKKKNKVSSGPNDTAADAAAAEESSKKCKRLPVVRSYSSDKASCAECGFHFVGSGMTLPTTLQKKAEGRVGDSDDESTVSAGYNSHHTASSLAINREAHSKHSHYPHGKPAQLAVRELYGARRGDGCVFCSWACARQWNHKHTPVQLKYQTDQLITIAAIQQEENEEVE